MSHEAKEKAVEIARSEWCSSDLELDPNTEVALIMGEGAWPEAAWVRAWVRIELPRDSPTNRELLPCEPSF